MKYIRFKSAIALATMIVLPLHVGATGRMTCEPIESTEWISDVALEDKLVSEGWKVRRMKVDGGCWEVYGTTPEGDRVEAYFHPASGEKLLVAQRGKILFRAEGVK